MPINIPDGLPTKKIPHNEYFFALEEKVAASQQSRPLRIVRLNLMLTMIETETQILRLISKSPLQVSLGFMRVSSHEVTHSRDRLVKFYETFATLKANNYDGLIATSTPVEQMPFEDMDYWQEFTEIFDWTDTLVLSMMCLCRDAMAKLCYKYSTHESDLPEKLFGVFLQRRCDEYNFLTNGFDELLYMPHSRHAMLDKAELRPHPELQVLSEGITSGPAIIATLDSHEIYLTGHFEYDRGYAGRRILA
jgi:homoserine O-succinyltransferase